MTEVNPEKIKKMSHSLLLKMNDAMSKFMVKNQNRISDAEAIGIMCGALPTLVLVTAMRIQGDGSESIRIEFVRRVMNITMDSIKNMAAINNIILH